jgi:uncharacterized protein YjdB
MTMFSGCDKENPEDDVVKVSGISLNKTTLTLAVGGGETLTATVAPDNAANKAVEWTSSDDAKVAVDQSGKVTAKAVGSAVITVTAKDGSNKSASCTVAVSAKMYTVTFDTDGGAPVPAVQNVAEGGKVNKPADPAKEGNIFDGWFDGAVQWNFEENTAIKDLSLKALWTVEGGNVAVTGVTLDISGMNIEVDATGHLTATITPGNASNQTVEWTTDDNSGVLHIEHVEGKEIWFVARKAGIVNITVKTADGGYEATCTVTVDDGENPGTLTYTFKDGKMYLSSEDGSEAGVFTYTPNGAFPNGTYVSDWMPFETDESEGGETTIITVGQSKLVLNADKTAVTYSRESANATPDENATWEEELRGTYEYTGTQATGGTFTFAFE